jgi:hypothetical protein
VPSRRRGPDAARLSALVARPGIDPRVWLTYARVVQLGYDQNEGIFADVQYLPSGEEDTAFVGTPYAGDGFGMWAPLAVDDIVLVAVPEGDSNTGPTIIARGWNGADKPHANFKAEEQQDGSDVPADDFVLRARPEKKVIVRTSSGGAVVIEVEGDGPCTIRTKGAGEVRIEAEGDGEINLEGKGAGAVRMKQSGSGPIYIYATSEQVYLGAESGTEPVPLGTTLKNYLEQDKTWKENHTHQAGAYIVTGYGAVTGTSGNPLTTPPSVPDIESDKVQVSP